MRLVLIGLLALSVSCDSKKVGRTPTPGDTRTPADASGGGDTMTGDPTAGDPLAGDPLAGDPLAGDPLAGDPLAGDPLAGDPLAGDPLAGDPLAGDPLAGDPLAGDPLAGDPLAGDPLIIPGDFLGCTADGPHVSNTTCVASNECGTVERPWCTIQAAIDNSATSPILVAGVSGRPYIEAITMTDGVDVQGGWDTGFASRDDDPATNGAVIRATTAVVWPAATTATLDGFTITDPAIATTDVGAVAGDATAEITLANVRVRQSTSVPGSAVGVAIGGTGAGSLTLTSCDLDVADATLASYGVLTGPNFNGSVVLTDTSMAAGSGTASGAVRLAGVDTLTVTSGLYDGGDGTNASVGIEVSDSAEVTLTDVLVNGGRGARAVAVNLAVNTDTIIDGGRITGGGLLGGTSAIGVHTEGSISIDGTSIAGADPDATGFGTLASGIGVDIGGAVDTINLATIRNAFIEGGDLALARTGISVDTAALDLQDSTVAGSTSDGGVATLGVNLAGSAPTAAHTIINNSITGGAPSSGNTGTYLASAIFSASATPTTVANNPLLRACDPECDGPGLGASNLSSAGAVVFTAGTGHLVDNNTAILGGPHTGTATNTAHAGISVGFLTSIGSSSPVGVEISGNPSIAGNTDAANRPANAVGIQGRDVDLLIDGNAEIFGGYATDNAAGVAVLYRNLGNNIVEVTNNDILAGAAAIVSTAMVVQGSNLIATDNFLDGCGIPSGNPGPAPECMACLSSDGLVAQGNPSALIANNFSFGGYAVSSDGCVITPPLAAGPGSGGTLAAYNLCLGVSHAASGGNLTRSEGLTIEGGSRLGYVFLNNIIGASDQALIRHGVREQDPITGITFENNDIIPDAGVAGAGVGLYVFSDGFTELDDIASVNALNGGQLSYVDNISVDPLFDAASVYAPTAAGFHLGTGCALRNLAQEITRVTLDYDGEARGESTSATNPAPEIGPDECP